MANKNEFMSVPAAAQKCGVDRRTMWRWVKSNKISSFVTPGGHHRILCSEIENILAQNGSLNSAAKRPKTILVVDDDESVRNTLEKQLARKSYQVATASDGFKAGLMARELQPDLVIVDLMMEGVDGFEVCRTIKNHPQLNKTKILILTGFDTAEHRKKALGEGADDFLAKSSEFKIVLEHINRLLAGR